MEGYKTDDEQIEHLKRWWQENGKSIIGGITIGLIAIFGWRGWQDHLVSQGEKASDLYEQMSADLRQEETTETQSLT